MSDPSIFISAGEASGEHYGALLIDELRNQLALSGRDATFLGMGGPRMVQAGLKRIVRSEDVAVMGITEVVRHLPRIYREFRKLKASIRQHRPDIAILIDFPDIHFKLAEEFHRLGIPVIFFVSPQLWAWKKHRIKLVQKYVSKMLVIFPFEEPFYREHGVEVTFVGHPLADLSTPEITRERFAREAGLNPERSWIALLPGSRPKEIGDNLPQMLAAARILSLRGPRAAGSRKEFEFVIPLAPTLNASQRKMLAALVRHHGEGLPVHTVDDARGALYHARASVVASGTATVEAALLGNPFIAVYRVSKLTYEIARRIVKVPFVAMPNLIAGKMVVPELIQNAFTAGNIVRQIEPLLPEGAVRESMKMELARIRDLLTIAPVGFGVETETAISRVAAITLKQLGSPVPAPVES
ncbi:lipid-A-disaccharide synthase [Occallatibacter savannae]|uniref:lipid-A-disaccharide synthase n=1 Tax=Occallatibacter savannae TaxID=1002691 RepID=UPI000D68C8F8|nr:lipid-A-disaccharide synthase [Occallatibacter savannae]